MPHPTEVRRRLAQLKKDKDQKAKELKEAEAKAEAQRIEIRKEKRKRGLAQLKTKVSRDTRIALNKEVPYVEPEPKPIEPYNPWKTDGYFEY